MRPLPRPVVATEWERKDARSTVERTAGRFVQFRAIRKDGFGTRRKWVYVFSVAAICQDIVGRCSFIDVLEEAVLVHRPVAVALRDGTRFIDVVVDVVTENGEDYAVFHNRERVAVTEIAATTRADPHQPRRL